jgi:hypothetical protein
MKELQSQTNGSYKNKFESDLATYFPDIWKLYKLGIEDRHIISVIETMVDMARNKFGTIEIIYQQGRINYVNQKVQVTANRGLTKTLK